MPISTKVIRDTFPEKYNYQSDRVPLHLPNKNVFKLHLKAGRVVLERILKGRSFHKRGPAHEEDMSQRNSFPLVCEAGTYQMIEEYAVGFVTRRS